MTQQNDAVTTQLAKLQDVLLEGRISQEIYELLKGDLLSAAAPKQRVFTPEATSFDSTEHTRPKPAASVSRPIPWRQGNPTPPDVYDDEIVVMLDGEPIRCVVGYNGEVKYNLDDEDEIMMLAGVEKERLEREAQGLPPPEPVKYEMSERWIGPGELAARAAMAACPDDMPEDEKYAIGKAAAFTAGCTAAAAVIA